MSKLIDGLSNPYPDVTKYRPIERVRKVLMVEVLPAGTDAEKAARIFSWVLQGNLRSLFPGSGGLNGIFSDGPNTLDLVTALKQSNLPTLTEMTPSLDALDVDDSVVALLQRYAQFSLPQRWVEVYCAIACLCALRRP